MNIVRCTERVGIYSLVYNSLSLKVALGKLCTTFVQKETTLEQMAVYIVENAVG